MSDGPKPRETPIEREMREIDAAIDIEEFEWHKVSMDSSRVTFHMLRQVVRIDTIVAMLIEKEIFTEDEMNLEYKKQLLSSLRINRLEFQGQIEEERKKASIVIPPIIGPHGRPLT